MISKCFYSSLFTGKRFKIFLFFKQTNKQKVHLPPTLKSHSKGRYVTLRESNIWRLVYKRRGGKKKKHVDYNYCTKIKKVRTRELFFFFFLIDATASDGFHHCTSPLTLISPNKKSIRGYSDLVVLSNNYTLALTRDLQKKCIKIKIKNH